MARARGESMVVIERTVRGVVVDLDDTLYPQRSFLAGAVDAAAARAQDLGFDRVTFANVFTSVLESGSDTGHTIDLTLARLGCSTSDVDVVLESLVASFSNYRPRSLRCYDGVISSLDDLSHRTKVSCLTDGNPDLQRAKMNALGIARYFDSVVITDELGGRPCRKPNPVGLEAVARTLGLEMGELVVIGDRVDKDVALAHRVGVPVVRVRQGEYRDVASPPGVATVDDFPSAVELVISEFLAERDA
jgi:putative hydrolase of the HAD superfamily